jgi:hypothetical protein
VLLGLIAFGRALLWGVGYDLAFCVAITIVVVCTWANTVGATIPIVAQRLGIDPTVISGPLITTLVDASGLFIYFTVAHLTIASLADKPDTSVKYDCSVVEVRQRPNQADEQMAVPFCDPDKPQPPCWRPGERAENSKSPLLPVEIDWLSTNPEPNVYIKTSCAPRRASALTAP